jgi:hypothetical protein
VLITKTKGKNMKKSFVGMSILTASVLIMLSGCGSTSVTDLKVITAKVVKSEKVAMICKSDKRDSVRMQAVTGGVISNADGIEYGRNIEYSKGVSVGEGRYTNTSGDIAESYFACESDGYLTTITYKHHLSGLQEHKLINTDRQLVIGSTLDFYM